MEVNNNTDNMAFIVILFFENISHLSLSLYNVFIFSRL